MFAGLLMIGNSIEWLVWGIICTGLLLGLVVRVGEGMHNVISWIRCHAPRALPHSHVATLLLVGSLIGVMLAGPAPAMGQGWWWGPPVNPGFDCNTVIQVTGTATKVNIVSRGGPSTLRLESSGEAFTVILGPGWYLAELRADIRSGDSLIVEGSKLMDPRGNLHLVAARITNQRTGTILELRDEAGRPRWMGRGPFGRPGP